MTAATGPLPTWALDRAEELTGRRLPASARVVRDTSDFMAIDRDSVVELGGELFLVTGTERERRFGLADEPKFWVKRALALARGSRHILKMVFQERFRACIGDLEVICVRSAEKEAAVLELVRDDPRFMAGHSVRDAAGNLVRILDVIEGENLLSRILAVPVDHEAYFASLFPGVLAATADSLLAIDRLHRAGLTHGDIRNDHIIVEAGSSRLRWIDFDLDQDTPAYDVWSIGNVLHCVVAKGFITFRDAFQQRPELATVLQEGDASVFFPFRVMNLGKVFPYIPAALSRVLERFAVSGTVRYDRVDQVAADLGECVSLLPRSGDATPLAP
ncbi:MAG: hypothetical protein ACM3O7_03570 [Acidobacteriota bacterium]